MASKIHPKMDRSNRAKQFMPFDALKGFREALAEKERVIVPKRELSEEWKAELDYRLSRIRRLDIIEVVFFEGGEYTKVTGVLWALDEKNRTLKITDKIIPFCDIYELNKISSSVV